jgi:hypothetical protein
MALDLITAAVAALGCVALLAVTVRALVKDHRHR